MDTGKNKMVGMRKKRALTQNKGGDTKIASSSL